MDDRPTLDTVHDLEHAVEALFPYCGDMDRAWIDRPWHDGRVVAQTLALSTMEPRAERNLLDAMYECFAQAKRTLGGRDDVGIMWRRRPHLITEDSGKVILRLRMALVDSDGQLNVSGLPVKSEGVPSKSID